MAREELVHADGTTALSTGSMPGVPPRTRGVLRHQSPSGHRNEGLYWFDLGRKIQWSHGESESTGYWVGPGQFLPTGELEVS